MRGAHFQQRPRSWPFIEPRPATGDIGKSGSEAGRIIHNRGAKATRLFTGLLGNSAPPLHPFFRPLKQPAIRTARLYRHDAGHSQFRSFLHSPLETLKLDEGQIQRHGRQFGPVREFFQQNELDAVLARNLNFGKPDLLVIGDLELLANLDTEDTCQMVGVLALYESSSLSNLIDKKPAAGHVQLIRHHMIALLRGTLIEKHPNQAILDVGGVGYDVTIPVSTFSQLPETGAVALLRIHMHVREDLLALYGFQTQDEKNLFEKLISVSGIGPGLAIKILSGIVAADLVNSIRRGELERLVRIPGVGKKTAERMVLELRDKLPALVGDDSGGLPEPSLSQLEGDVMSALLNLGCARPAAEVAVRKARATGAVESFEGLFRKALELVR